MRTIVIFVLAGATLTVGVAWGCAIWSPARMTTTKWHGDSLIAPDGTPSNYYVTKGVGFSRLDEYRDSPYGGVGQMAAGWPMRAVRSRVEVLDSQLAGRTYEDDPQPPEPVHQRRRWELPGSEILSRGPATRELPAWVHASFDRRLPMIPIPLAFGMDTLLYAVAVAAGWRVVRVGLRRVRRVSVGFPVVLNAERRMKEPELL